MQLLSDIRNNKTLQPRQKLYLTAFLIALSAALSLIDTLIPKPIPFAKIGLANSITLLLIMEEATGLALEVAALRTVLSAVLLGTLLSYTFLLSFVGAMVSVAFTALFFLFFRERFSAVGLSVIGAFFHTLGQGAVIFAIFGLDKGTLFLLSLLLLAGLVTGIVNGIIVKKVLSAN